MGISGIMRTSTSGMQAQSNRVSTVADNIANVSTTGYKRTFTEFSSFIPGQATGTYNSGSVTTAIRHAITQQGTFNYTTSPTDLSVNGQGMFLVSDPGGQVFMTRAGNFVKNGDGDLINAGGFTLQGYSLAGGTPAIVANGTEGLVPVNIGQLALQANPSQSGQFYVNMPSTAAIVPAADLPSANAASATFTGKTSLVAYDSLGAPVTLDVYSTKTAADNWEVVIYDRATAAPGVTPFPYTTPALATVNLVYDPTTGQLTSGSPKSVTVPVPNGGPLQIDLSQSSQLAADYTVITAQVDGNGPSAVDRVEITDDGTLYAVYQNGARVPTYQIPLATVPSADNLQPLPGDVFQPSADSGDMLIGFGGAGGFGVVQSSALEQSTVDMAAELATMIESERNFQVNSKVFQTGADMLDVVVQLKR